jgi:hypothetical protein
METFYFVIFIFLYFFDYQITKRMLRGGAKEHNPFMNLLHSHFGMSGIGVYKIFVVLILGIYLQRDLLPAVALQAIIIITAAVVLFMSIKLPEFEKGN